jgi:DNA-binding IclR family transcriptional regulator
MSNVQSVERAFAILRRLASGPAGVSELADRVDLPKSTVSRLLSTLEHLGAVEQPTSGGPYRIGHGMVEIVTAVLPSRSLLDAVHPHLVELTNLTGEATGLAIRAGTDVRYIDQVESNNPVQVRDWTGTSVPLHAVPSGLVMLAYSSGEDQRAYLSRKLVTFTSRTVADPTSIATRLKQIRDVGYAWVYEEFSVGINSVAVPLRDKSGIVVAALHAHGPAYRFPKVGDESRIAAEVQACAVRIRAGLSSMTLSEKPPILE